MERIPIIINVRSGSVAKDTPEKVEEAFRRAGLEPELHLLPEKNPIDIARQAVEQGASVVVVGGGDGTVSAVAGVLAGGPTALALLPLGTLNHFAKDLHLPQQLEEAVRLIAAVISGESVIGHIASVDVADVNGHIFVNNSSIGLYPRVVKRRDRLRERLGHGKWLSMGLAIINVFRRFPLVDVQVNAGGEIAHRSTPFVFVGNNVYAVEGLSLGERQSLEKGELCLYMAHRPGRWGMVLLFLRAVMGRLDQARDFDSLCLSEATVSTRRRRIAVAADGEVHWMTPPLQYRVRPGSLKVIAPR